MDRPKIIDEILKEDRGKQLELGNGKPPFDDKPNYNYLRKEDGWLKSHEKLVKNGVSQEEANKLLGDNARVTSNEERLKGRNLREDKDNKGFLGYFGL